MPSIRLSSSWEAALRAGVRTSTAVGWSLREQRGGVRLEVRHRGQTATTVVLPFEWSKLQVGAILARVRNIYVLTLEGHELQEAAAIAAGKAPSSRCSWADALASFQEQKIQHGSAIKPATWVKTYEPVLSMAVQLLEQSKGPTTAVDLLDASDDRSLQLLAHMCY